VINAAPWGPIQEIPVASPEAIITRDGERALRSEVERLRAELDVEFAHRLREARDFGEGGSNDDYLQIKEEEAVLRSRIARLRSLLDTATVVEPSRGHGGVITIGSAVSVEDLESGRVDDYRVVGSFERGEGGSISAASPFGQALMGRRAGEVVEVRLPSGVARRLRVIAARP
jgi:transcription elongation factor GreA